MGAETAKKPAARSLSRLFAVQGLYLLAMNEDATPDQIVGDLGKISIGVGDDFPSLARADQTLLHDIINGAFERGEEIKSTLEGVLTKGWKYERLEALLRVILSAGTYELIARPDIPHPVIINEYVDVAHAYYEGDEPGFVNGILNEISKTARAPADG